ncbi:MAG: hypothetical protein F6K65_25135 [Moorea sp. SIO3C2]|nr:hypothetical protein [Moorena sp. SIO3C2]
MGVGSYKNFSYLAISPSSQTSHTLNPLPCSLFPVPCSLLPAPFSLRYFNLYYFLI